MCADKTVHTGRYVNPDRGWCRFEWLATALRCLRVCLLQIDQCCSVLECE